MSWCADGFATEWCSLKRDNTGKEEFGMGGSATKIDDIKQTMGLLRE